MSTSKYLQNLKFDKNLNRSFFAKYLTNFRLVTLVVIAVIAFGLQAYFSLPRKLNPTINIPLVIVSTVLPGSSPSDIESLITIPIENKINTIDGVKTVTSSSRDSVSIVQIEFESGTDPEKARSDVDSAVSEITDFPEDALDPTVEKLDFENQPIWTFNLISEKNDRASLIRFARRLKNDLEDLPTIDRVAITGLDEQEIQILLRPETISSYQISLPQLTGIIRNSLNSYPAGVVKTDTSVLSLTIDPDIVTIDDIRNLALKLNGSVVTLGEIATIQEVSKPDQNQSYVLSEGNINPSVSFNVFRVTSFNIEQANEDATNLVQQTLTKEGENFSIKTVMNSSEILTHEFSILTRDVTLTIFLVFVVLLIFLGIRQALISMLSVPLTFLITFFVMQVTGIEFSFLATFSLLLSLGLLVDDTIVVISAMTAYYRTRKFTPLETALLVYRDFRIAILTTTITTVWAFIPLILGSGIIGEFIKPIPIVVSSALLGSLLVAFLITAPLMVFLLRPMIPMRVRLLLLILLFAGVVSTLFFLILPQSTIVLVEILAFAIFIAVLVKTWPYLKKEFVKRTSLYTSSLKLKKALGEGLINLRAVEREYHTALERILSSKRARRNTVITVVVFCLFSFLLVPFGFVKNEFFPKTDEDNLYISIEFPTGTNLDVTSSESLAFLSRLKTLREAEFITLETGQSFSPEMGPGGGGSNTVLYSIVLDEDRKRTASEIAEELRMQLDNYDRGKVSVNEISGGPPAGSDLQIKLFGPDLTTLDQYANRIQEYLSTQTGVTNIDKTIKPGISKLSFTPDKAKLASQNVTVEQLGLLFRTFASGLEADTLKIPNETDLIQDITIRMSEATPRIEDISRIGVPVQNGTVAITSLGKIELKTSPALITREDGKRTISVVASVTSGYNVTELNAQLEDYADSLNLPEGYGWATGGVNEENQESVNSILQAMIYSFLLIIATLVLQFSSFRRALIVMLVIPLSITGVFIIFAITGTPLSFPALIGILALFGIVVKNSILVVDKIITNQKVGMGFTDSIIEASTSRLEPIALTSIATIVGLTPITLSDPLWRGLGGAIIAGLFFSGTIMLFFIPVVYYMIYSRYHRKEIKN